MYKRSLVICLALIMASASYGDIPGDWEQEMDGWTVNGGTPTYSSEYGVTSGNCSLAVWLNADTGGNNFSWNLYNGDMWQYYDWIAQGAYFAIDVTWVASEWYDDGGDGAWAQVELLAVNSNPGWGQWQCVDTANPSYPGSWDPYNWGEVHTRELRWYMSNYDMAGAAGAYWMQFSISTNYGRTDVIPGAIYFDNARIVPEPATIAMLGLGALALRRRKRKP
ncbi:MAG: PEP-CTERM sorting domain-containing protein [Planctomycetota bacterium]